MKRIPYKTWQMPVRFKTRPFEYGLQSRRILQEFRKKITRIPFFGLLWTYISR